MTRLALTAALAVLGFALAAPSAEANTFVVSTTADDANSPPAGSLRAAVINSNGVVGPDLIDATAVGGVIELEGALPMLREAVEIRGPGPAALTVRRGEGTPDFRILGTVLADVEISGITVAGGRWSGGSDGGGGILNLFGNLTLRDVVVSGNESAGSGSGGNGGGIANAGAMTPATLTLIDSAVSGNRSVNKGGGIHNNGSGTVSLLRSTVSGNTSEGGSGCSGGGGIFNSGTLVVTTSTVSGNTVDNPGAPELGGGIHTCAGGANSVTLLGSTIAANSAERGANLNADRKGASAELRSTILADPRGGGVNCDVDEPEAVLLSRDYNLADDGSCALTEANDRAGSDPLLGPLADNGGPTLTHALLPGSPAIDRGSGVGQGVDQRGLPRAVDLAGIAQAPGGDGSDVGALELQSTSGKPPSNEFRITAVRRSKRKGVGALKVQIPGPGELILERNRKVRPLAKQPKRARQLKLKVRPRGKAKRRLSTKRLRASGKRRARVRVRARVTYTPTGGQARTKTKKLRLVRRP